MKQKYYTNVFNTRLMITLGMLKIIDIPFIDRKKINRLMKRIYPSSESKVSFKFFFYVTSIIYYYYFLYPQS